MEVYYTDILQYLFYSDMKKTMYDFDPKTWMLYMMYITLLYNV